MRKSLTLLPAGVLAAVIIGSACAPPPPPQQPPPPPPPTTPVSTTCAAPSSAKAGPDGSDPISSWGVDGTALASVVIGNVVYVGGNFFNAVSPTGATSPRHGVAAFCLADGSLMSFAAHFDGGPVNALATDGSNLFVGGNFTTLNGGAVNRLVKLNASGVRDTGFAPQPIPAPGAGGVTPPTDGVLALAYAPTTGILYAGGDFGKIGTGAGGAQHTQVDNAAGFTANGTLTSFTGGADKKVSSIATSPNGDAVFIGGTFTNVKGSARGQVAKIDVATNTVAGSNLAIGADVRDIVVTGTNDFTGAVGGAVNGAPPGSGRRLVAFSASTPLLNDVNPKGDVNGVELIGGLDYFGMSKGYSTNSGPNLVGVDPTQAVGSANYMPFATTAAGGIVGIADLAQSAGGARLVAVGDFTSVGTTGGLHGVAIFG